MPPLEPPRASGGRIIESLLVPSRFKASIGGRGLRSACPSGGAPAQGLSRRGLLPT